LLIAGEFSYVEGLAVPRFKEMPMPPGQLMLYGQSVEDALPQDNDVRVFDEIMDYLDYSDLESRYSDMGCPAYSPKTLVKVLGYAYSKGIRSSRRIEECLHIDVRFIWLAGGLAPDHNTIARFRKGGGADLENLFKDSVRLCMRAGLVFLNSVSTDGSKLVAAASKKQIYNRERVEREMKRVEQILQEAQEVDRAEDELYGSGNGNEMPQELRDINARKARLREIAGQFKETNGKNVVSSDPESRVMKTRNNGKCPAYNLQASVDADNQIIVAMELTADETDTGHLPEMVEQTECNTGVAPGISLVDSGYWDERTLKWAQQSGHDVLMPVMEQPREAKRTDLFASKCFLYDDERDVLVCPAGRDLVFGGRYKLSSSTYKRYAATGCRSCSLHDKCCGKKANRRINVSVTADIRQRMRDRLQTQEGKQLYRLRKQTVEPAFGQMKTNRHFERLLLHGYAGALAETALMCLIHNILKCASNADARRYLVRIQRRITPAAKPSVRLPVLAGWLKMMHTLFAGMGGWVASSAVEI
jgi:transposase